jgi:hypothetical protein
MIPVDAASSASHPAPAPDGAAVSARAVVEAQLAMLSRLAEIGMEIAEACGRDAKAAPAEALASPHAPGLVFARVARAVRMTIALQSRLLKDLAALDRVDAIAERARKDTRRIRLSRLVEQAARAGVEAQREAGGRYWADEEAIEDEVERLSWDAYERLTDAEDGEQVDGLSFDAAVAAVIKDLGLSADWAARLSAAVAPPPDPVACGRAGGRDRTSFDGPVVPDGRRRVPGSPPTAPPEDDGGGTARAPP